MALLMIFVDHIPDNPLFYLTLRGFALADGAEVFVLVSGYVAGTVYGRTLERSGLHAMAARVGWRAWRIYLTHLVLYAVYALTTVWAARHFNAAAYAYAQGFSIHAGAADFFCRGDHSVLSVLVLYCQPDMTILLPLYVLLLLWLPLILLAIRWHPMLALVPSAAMWTVVQVTSLNLPSATFEIGWLFNPFAWQFLFVIGACLGFASLGTQAWRFWPAPGWPSRWRTPLLLGAAGIAITCAVIQVYWSLGGNPDIADSWLPEGLQWRLVNKQQFGAARLLSILALAALVAVAIRPDASWLSSAPGSAIVRCGQHSLELFALGILLAQWSEIVLEFVSDYWLVLVALNILGVMAHLLAARLLDWGQHRARAGLRRVGLGRPAPVRGSGLQR